MTKKTMTFAELIGYTGMTRKQLQCLINSGNLRFINTNCSGSCNVRYAFLVSEVDNFLDRVPQTMMERK